MKAKFIIMNKEDNCATSLVDIPENYVLQINNTNIKIANNIPVGHKFALNSIYKGEKVFKYGEIIGIATEDIHTGEWIHIHNIKSYYLEGSKDE